LGSSFEGLFRSISSYGVRIRRAHELALQSLVRCVPEDFQNLQSLGKRKAYLRTMLNEKEIEDKLSKYYEISKAKAAQYTRLAANSDMNVSSNLAARTYFVLSTLLYTSVNAVKLDEYEQFLAQSARKLPSNMFDWAEWEDIVNTAKQLRANIPSLQSLDVAGLIAALDAPTTLQTDEGKQRLQQLKKKLIPLLHKERSQYTAIKQTLKETEHKYYSALTMLQQPSKTANKLSRMHLNPSTTSFGPENSSSLLFAGSDLVLNEAHNPNDSPTNDGIHDNQKEIIRGGKDAQKGFREWSRVLRRSMNNENSHDGDGRDKKGNPFVLRPMSASAVLQSPFKSNGSQANNAFNPSSSLESSASVNLKTGQLMHASSGQPTFSVDDKKEEAEDDVFVDRSIISVASKAGDTSSPQLRSSESTSAVKSASAPSGIPRKASPASRRTVLVTSSPSTDSLSSPKSPEGNLFGTHKGKRGSQTIAIVNSAALRSTKVRKPKEDDDTYEDDYEDEDDEEAEKGQRGNTSSPLADCKSILDAINVLESGKIEQFIVNHLFINSIISYITNRHDFED
jgi:hypothetical protein